jgi:hypothetical protein
MRASFITSAYGSKRPGRPGTPVLLTAGQTRNVVVRMWRGAVIAGVLRDDTGEPVAGVSVTAVRVSGSNGSSLTLTNNGGVTNDRGEYRIFGLEPGTYLVSARPASAGGTSPMIALATADVDAALEALRARRPTGGAAPRPAQPSASARPFEHAPIYYPGVPARSDASPITLVAGQEASGMDFALQRVMTLVVEGQVTRPDGHPAAGAQVQLTPAGSMDFATEQESILNATAGPDGTFRFRQVTPGNYTLFARSAAQAALPAGVTSGIVQAGARGPQLWATTKLSVAGDLSGIALTLKPPLTLSGRVRFDSAGTKPPANLTQLRVTLFPPSVLQNVRPGVAVRTIAFVPPGTVRADGTFELTNVVPGHYVFGVTGPALDGTEWWLKSARLDGRDILDGRIEISAETNLSGVDVTFTDRRSELSGTLQTAAGDAASDVFVIACSSDRRHWGPNARRVQAVRPGVDGKYVIKDLPAGEYLVAAVTDVDQDEWQDPAFLERLQSASVRVTITEGEKKVLNLRIAR